VDPTPKQAPMLVGRYAVYGAIASGGMATVHYGRLLGPVGFSRTVAIKRLHPQYAGDPEFVHKFMEEARLAARIHHPNVVQTIDVVQTDGELFLVMDYVPGESLARLARGTAIAPSLRVISTIVTGALYGLHAAHEARDEHGRPLGLVHRDVSPQNILVGTDGIPKILDFGIAKAEGRGEDTGKGLLKGKLAYMPPEQLKGERPNRRIDIYAAGVILWELLTGDRLFAAENEALVFRKILDGNIPRVADVVRARRLGAAERDAIDQLDDILSRALAQNPEDRFATAKQMALEIERCVAPATSSEVGEWVETAAQSVLRMRAERVAEIESASSLSVPQAVQEESIGVARNAPVPFPSETSMSGAQLVAHEEEEEPQRAWIPYAAGGLGVLVGLVALFIAHSRVVPAQSGPAPTPTPSQTATTAPPPPVSAAAAPPIPTIPTVPPSVAPPPEPPPSATATATATATAKRKPVYVPNPCNPPYTIDAQGVKVYKPQCVK